MFGKSSSYFLLFISALLTGLLLIFRPVPKFDYDFEQFFPQDDPDLSFYRGVYEKNFGSDNDYLLLAISNPDGDWLDSAFLSRSAKVKTEIQSLSGVDTLISIFDLQIPIINAFGLQTFPVLDWSSGESIQSSAEKLDQFKGSLIAQDGSSFLFLIQNDPKLSKEEGDTLYERIVLIMAQNGIKPHAVAGKIQTQRDFVSLMQEEFGLFIGASLVLMLLVLFWVFRKPWGILIPILVLVIGILWALGLILLAGKPLDIMSVMQPTIFLIVGLSALIHYFTHLIKKLKKGLPKEEAIQETFKELTFAVALTVFTTSMGFISLYFTSIPALKAFGLWTGIGILVLFLAILAITPGLLHTFPLTQPKDKLPSKGERFLSGLLQKIILRRKLIAGCFFSISLLGLVLSTQLQINGYLLDNLPLDHPIQKDFAYFDQYYGGSNPLELYLERGSEIKNLMDLEALAEIEKVEEKLRELFGEGEFISPLSIAKTLNQAQNQGNQKAFALPSRGQFLRMQRYIDQALRQEGPKVLSEDLLTGRISGRAPDLGSLRMGELRSELLDFVQKEIDPQILKVKWTGTAHLIDRGHESVTRQMAKGLGVAFLIVGLIAGALFKSWRLAFILLIPNVIPLIWMCGLMWLLGIEFKLTTAILFTVAFGIAVDDTIHFMSKLKLELAQGKNLHYAIKRTFMEAGRAIILTSIILVAGFGLLIFSRFGVTHFTGLLISFSLIFALLADLFLLPVLLFPLKKVWEQKFKAPSHPR
ncbi:RND family transporter [Algoriphagus sp. AK58]|uniref:efflux RND transporter permease subunit n=1 Tax=Algoriphagus sp. AK58 TaxID=1406877 RepID=UPI00164EE675|nr:efflux RND transporter permease subunit [Algoriphagus sp. AK58]MBC6367446.1 RND transporter [Algoriphagus sp. AK58]